MSIEAIAAALAEVRDGVLAAHHDVQAARTRLGEAVGTLSDLARNHPDPLLPPEFRQAEQKLADGLEFLAGLLAAVDAFQAGL